MSALVESMAYAGEVPWHGLGVEVEPTVTPEEMLKAAGLDWLIEKEKLRTESGIIVPDMHSLTRVRPSGDRDSLGVCGPDYTPFQNHEVFDFFKRFVDAGDMEMHTAGALRDGKLVWGLAKLSEGFTLTGGDEVSGYLLLSSPHQWGKGFRALFSPIRVVCNNTLTYALQHGKGQGFTMPHITAFDDDVKRSAAEALGLCHQQMTAFKEQAEFLSKTPAQFTDVQRFMATLFEPQTLEDTGMTEAANDADVRAQVLELSSKRAQDAMDALYLQPGATLPSSKGTWWGAVNAVTFLVDHKLGRDRDASVEQAWFGQRATLKRKAVETALEFARAA